MDITLSRSFPTLALPTPPPPHPALVFDPLSLEGARKVNASYRQTWTQKNNSESQDSDAVKKMGQKRTNRCHGWLIVGNSTTGSVPGYSGKLSWYLAASSGGTNRPPRKCRLPLKSRAHIFGAVSETSTWGCIPDAQPFSTSQPILRHTSQWHNWHIHIQCESKKIPPQGVLTFLIFLTNGWKFLIDFYPRDAMLARVIEIATCLSVCLSRAGIVSKRRKLAAWFLHHLVAPRL